MPMETKKQTVDWIDEDGLSLEARRDTVAGTTREEEA
mgnify:CR=1 FL=1